MEFAIHMKFHFAAAAAAAAATGNWGSCALGSFMVAFKDTNKCRHTRPGKWEKKGKKKLLINLDNQVSRESINIKSSHICMY